MDAENIDPLQDRQALSFALCIFIGQLTEAAKRIQNEQKDRCILGCLDRNILHTYSTPLLKCP